MLIISNQEENKEENKENIIMTVYNQPQLVLNTQKSNKSYLGTDLVSKTSEKNNGNNYFINYIKNNIKNTTIKNNSKKNENQSKDWWCYNKDSQDMRCCGLCYTCCYIQNKEDQCYMCPETFEIYYTSGYVITTAGYGKTDEECDNCLCTTLCLPFKIALFWPCLLGSIVNNSINWCRDTSMNYLC